MSYVVVAIYHMPVIKIITEEQNFYFLYLKQFNKMALISFISHRKKCNVTMFGGFGPKIKPATPILDFHFYGL